MKLSDALLFGGSQYEQAFGSYVRGLGELRCAWGAAAGAAGCKSTNHSDIGDFICKNWTWTTVIKFAPPCECAGIATMGFTAYSGILHLNDQHKWPIAKIAAWVATVEPPAEETQDVGRAPAESETDELVLSK